MIQWKVGIPQLQTIQVCRAKWSCSKCKNKGKLYLKIPSNGSGNKKQRVTPDVKNCINLLILLNCNETRWSIVGNVAECSKRYVEINSSRNENLILYAWQQLYGFVILYAWWNIFKSIVLGKISSISSLSHTH